VEQAALNFNITFDDPSGKFSRYYSVIKSHILAAGLYWDNYIVGNASLEIVVSFSNTNPTVTGRSLTSYLVDNNGSIDVYEAGATAEIRTQIDPNSVTPDIEFNFNPDYLVNDLWFDPDPSARISPIPNNKIDAFSIFLHEFGHVFGINGWKDGIKGQLPGNYQSTFDEQVTFDGKNFFFVGSEAISVYGSPVPLTFGNINHVGNDLPRPGRDLIADLMNGVVYERGVRYDISPLDLAILKDTGVPIFDDPSITGDNANNTLNGGAGNDILNGGAGNDILNGGIGNDTLIGGAGSDRLTGGIGKDKFVFTSLSERTDTITDFSSTDDVLVLQTLLINLNYIGTNPIADGYIQGIQSGSNTLIQIDADGVAGSAIFNTLVTLSNFIASNFSPNNLIV
jgi:Ca2+-binding RTX toxin-like protein